MSRVSGLTGLIKGIRAKQRKDHARLAKGLKKAGLHLLRLSMAIVPVDIGDLRSSAYIRHEGSGAQTVVIVGYTAEYAVYVHEIVEAAHGEAYNQKYAKQIAAKDKYWYKGEWRVYHKRGKNQQAKFLEQPLRENRNELRKIIREEG